jgi:cellulose synthase operon protein C
MARALMLAAAMTLSGWACAAQAQDGDAAYRAGRYEEATSFFQRRIESGGGVDAFRGLARVYLETGKYAEAETLLAGSPHANALGSLLSEAYRAQGKLAAAHAAARAGLAGADSLPARLQLALIAREQGNTAEASKLFDTFIDSYNSGRALSSDELVAVGVAVKHLGNTDPQLFKDALKAFDEAVARDPANHRAHIEVGRLFLEKYNSDEAGKAFRQVLRTNPKQPDALTGLAEVLNFDNQAGAVDTARKALENNPSHLGARAFLTHAFLMTDMVDSARVHADAAQRVNPNAVESVIANASVAQVAGNRERVTAALMQLRGPAAAELHVALAELSVQQRQYAEGVRLARTAISHDSTSWAAYSVLGINQLRTGDIAAARVNLEKSFAGDPYNVWVKNSLDMLDRLEKFETRTTPRFQIVANAKEIDVLAPYIAALGDEAFTKLTQRYGYSPATPVRIELFDRHADFSVRTVGLAGLGALGVAFGNVLAMDAPSARKPGEFNWGATFWHELAHAFHLGMTNHRVPRWFTEGLATLEERRARAGWGEEGLPSFAEAMREKRLLPLAELNNGFVRPTYPNQVGVSYYQASLILEMIEQRHGVAALRGMLQGYAQGKNTEAVLRDVLKTTPKQIDDEFGRFAALKVADPARAQAAQFANDYSALLAQGTPESLELAMYVSPYDINAHARLADLYARSGNKAGVLRERQAIVALQPVDMAEARYQLALAHFELGDRAAARKLILQVLENAPHFEKALELLARVTEQR